MIRVVAEHNELGQTRGYSYDLTGNRTGETDRDGRVREFKYDYLGRLTDELWKERSTTVYSASYVYDAASQLKAASDNSSSYASVLDDLGRPMQITSTSGGTQTKLLQEFDAVGNRTVLSADLKIGEGDWTSDFVNTYTYDNLNRQTQVKQPGLENGNAVAEKRIDFAYDPDGQFASINRYDELDGGAAHLVAQTAYDYDGAGRLTDLTHTRDTTTFADYQWTYDDAGRLSSMSFTSLAGQSGATTYAYDSNGQLLGADSNCQSDEGYSYDANGNRTMAGYVTGQNNELQSDGTFTYQYDGEGNRIKRTRISTTAAADYVTDYTWDYHNRLTKVTFKDNAGVVTKEVNYTYDVFDRRIGKSIDWDGAGTQAAVALQYVYDGQNILLALDGTGSLTNRYLSGPAGDDNVLADEQFQPSTPAEMPEAIGDLFWLLTDKMNSVRDMLERTGGAGGTGNVSVANHITYDSYGNVTQETNPAVSTNSGFQGAERDKETGLQRHGRRYMDPRTGRWISEDPIELEGGDTNFARFVRNAPTNGVDPSGLSVSSFVDDLNSYFERSPRPSKGKARRIAFTDFGRGTSPGLVFDRKALRAIQLALMYRDLGDAIDEIALDAIRKHHKSLEDNGPFGAVPFAEREVRDKIGTLIVLRESVRGAFEADGWGNRKVVIDYTRGQESHRDDAKGLRAYPITLAARKATTAN